MTSIGEAAFQRCSSLTSLDIPESVVRVEDLAFAGCTSLSSVTAGKITEISANAFEVCTFDVHLSLVDLPCRLTWPILIYTYLYHDGVCVCFIVCSFNVMKPNSCDANQPKKQSQPAE